MPGRKSGVSTTSNGPEEVSEITSTKPGKERKGMSVDELSLPKSMIARLAKGVLPLNTQIQKDALLALHKSATVFVSYIASNSHDNATASGKKTISPQDVIAALKDAELEDFLPRLEAELKKHNETQCDKRNNYRRKVKEEKAAAETKDGDSQEAPQDDQAATEMNGTANGHTDSEFAERPAKKLKRDDGDAVPQDGGDADDEDADEQFMNGDDPEDTESDDAIVDEVDDDDDENDDDEDGQDETMDDPLEDSEDRGEVQDEALDDPDESD